MSPKEEWAVQRRVWAYCLTGIATAIVAAGTIVAFCYALYPVGAILASLTLIGTLAFAGEIVQDNFYQKSERLFAARKFDEEKELIEKVKNNHLLFPFVRERYYMIAIRNALARDDLALVKSYIDRLRHGDDRLRHGDDHNMKYKTAYAYILILLDEGEFSAAVAEYEDFRTHNEHYTIYKLQLEVLKALFARLSGKRDVPLPEAAVNTPYPIIKRILGRHFEESMANAGAEWDD